MLVFAILLSGCVYLRLLTVKKQIKDFDANFHLSGRPELIILFKNPVLLNKDIRFLIGTDPYQKTTDGLERVWHYEFEAVRNGPALETPMEKLSLRLHMQEKKLVKIVIPETFMFLFPRNVLTETIRQAANAEVLKVQKTLRHRMRLLPDTDAELPSLNKTLSLLGPAQEIVHEEDGAQTLIYQYRITRVPNKVPIFGRLTFSEDGLLRRVFIKWDTSSVDAHYERDESRPESQNESGPQ